jgi:hypothetical protein
MIDHRCHAHGCVKSVPPRLLMCLSHWRMVPPELQRLVWKHYRPGQEIDKLPSEKYLMVQRAAVWAVFVAEGGCQWPDVPEVGTLAYMRGPSVMAKGAS